MIAAVESVTINAQNGLYLTPDMWLAANFLVPHHLETTVTEMHKIQPLTADFDVFSEHVNETYHRWRIVKSSLAGLDNLYIGFGHQMMAAADLARTHQHINHGLIAATDLALAIMLRTARNSDQFTTYRRAIPNSLATMQINNIDEINADTYTQIFTAEPWLSWLGRLRAQRDRTLRTLANPNAPRQLTTSMEVVRSFRRPLKMQTVFQTDRRTKRTIRKSADMFQRFLGRAALQDFLISDRGKPFMIAGHYYNYELNKRLNTLFDRSNNFDQGTSMFGTNVFNKAGDRLCELCVYFENTPILDSVVAIALHVQNPETELDFLNRACVIDTPGKFYDDPALPELKYLTEPNTAPTLIDSVTQYAFEFTALRESMQHETLRHAYRAFMKINRTGEQYFPLMRMCGGYTIWDYFEGNVGAMAFMKLVQAQIKSGAF